MSFCDSCCESKWLLLCTLGRHEGRKERQDGSQGALFFTYLLVAFGLTISISRWLTQDQSRSVTVVEVKAILSVCMLIGFIAVIVVWCCLYQQSSAVPGHSSFHVGSARDCIMHHLPFIGLCVFFIPSLGIDALPIYSQLQCAPYFYACHVGARYMADSCYHLLRILFKIFVVAFAWQFEWREFQRGVVIRYCVLAITLAIICNWIDALVVDAAMHFKEIDKNDLMQSYNSCVLMDLVQNSSRLLTIMHTFQKNDTMFQNCMHKNTNAYSLSKSSYEVLFPFDVEFSLVALKILIHIYYNIKLVPAIQATPGAGPQPEEHQRDPATGATPGAGTQPQEHQRDPATVATPGAGTQPLEHQCNPATGATPGAGTQPQEHQGDQATGATPGTGTQPQGHQSDPATGATPGAGTQLQEHQSDPAAGATPGAGTQPQGHHSDPATGATQDTGTDPQGTETFNESSKNCGSETEDQDSYKETSFMIPSPLPEKGKQQKPKKTYNTFPPQAAGEGSSSAAMGFPRDRRSIGVGTPQQVVHIEIPGTWSPAAFPCILLFSILLNLALLTIGAISLHSGHKVYTYYQMMYWIPLIIASFVGLAVIDNTFESEYAEPSALEYLVYVSMLGGFCHLFLLLYAAVACLLGTSMKGSKAGSSCGTTYGSYVLWAGLWNIVLNFIQMFLQITLMAFANNVKTSNRTSKQYWWLRQCLFFLFIGNLCLWLVDSFVEMKNPFVHPGQKYYYQEMNEWIFIVHIFIPFFLFFRFNCALIFLQTFLKLGYQET